MIIHTGAGGFDLFNEAMEREFGFERVYIGKKTPRFLRKPGTRVRKSASGRYYKLLRLPVSTVVKCSPLTKDQPRFDS